MCEVSITNSFRDVVLEACLIRDESFDTLTGEYKVSWRKAVDDAVLASFDLDMDMVEPIYMLLVNDACSAAIWAVNLKKKEEEYFRTIREERIFSDVFYFWLFSWPYTANEIFFWNCWWHG